MTDLLNDTSKFTGSVDDIDNTAIQEYHIRFELLGFYKEHLVSKNIDEKIRPLVFRDSLKFTNTTSL